MDKNEAKKAGKTASAPAVSVQRIVSCISDDLCRAIAIAAIAHDGQLDKGKCDYICHPLHVMNQMKTKEEKIVAVLHDVVEDSGITIDDLKACGFSKNVITTLEILTRRDGEPYFEYIERVMYFSLARAVKIADLEHNMDIRRLFRLKPKDIERLAKYQDALALLKIS